MMDDLNNKLRETLVEHSRLDYLRSEENGKDFNIDDFVAQIHQAYKEAGYVTVDKRRYRDEYGREYMQYTFPNEFVRVPQFSFITGQEWFEKFCYEVLPEGGSYEEGDTVLYDKVMDAARKAGGIS